MGKQYVAAARADNSFHLISDGHRAVELAGKPGAHLYTQAEFRGTAQSVSPEFWMDTFIPLLRRFSSERVAARLTAAAKRARTHVDTYQAGELGPAELATEIFFDRQLTRPREQFRSRASLHCHLRSLRESRARLRIGLPLFSRKPVSPVKNRGPYPDLAEIASLLRCHELAAMLSWVYDEEVEFLIFADGMKYRRACRTAMSRVQWYQDGLRFWSDQLGIGDLVKIVDYEDALSSALGVDDTWRRESRYEEYCAQMAATYGRYFDPYDPKSSLAAIGEMSPEGAQLAYTFRSIASTVSYQTDELTERVVRGEDEAACQYLTYIGNVFVDLRSAPSGTSSLVDVARDVELRTEAWQAAICYVAISLVDRELDVWSLINPAGVKMTIHGKSGEIQIRPTRSEYTGVTAQHSVGGITHSSKGNKITFSYRLQHESGGDTPVLFDGPASSAGREGIPTLIQAMAVDQQPICYVSSTGRAPLEILSDCVADL